MNDAQHTHRAHVINLCYDVVSACGLTDLEGLKIAARGILRDMGEDVAEEPNEDWRDLL